MKVTYCRLCKTGRLSEPVLIFPPTPLANEFLNEPDPQDEFPLEVATCESCQHYQLTESIDPERLFSVYSYAAGHSAANIAHFEDSAKHHAEKFELREGSRVLDIASNDGTLLGAFKELGMSVLGMDPAENLAIEANAKGIETIVDFFTAERAKELKKERGPYDLVTANNVFAHVPDLEDFAKGVKTVLAAQGVFSFEVSYFLDVCDKALFDTIYHEHSSYHTLTPLIPFFENLNMELFDVERIPNHGGSIRVFVRNAGSLVGSTDPQGTLAELLAQERSMSEKVTVLKDKVDRLGKELRELLQGFKAEGKSIAVFGAPAKATTLMYTFGLTKEVVDFVIDDSPLKQGLLTPGTHIPIYSSSIILERNPDVLLVLAWNFVDTIITRHPEFKGTWIVPLPELRTITV